MFNFKNPEPPSQDKAWKFVTAEMRKYGYEHHALIQVLHAIQDSFGYLDKKALLFVAQSLRLPLSKVYGVATFYHYFTLKPAGKHTCVLCTGTACYIKGVPELLATVKEKYGINMGETSGDGKLSLLSARCVGACGLAPVAVIDGKVVGKLTPEMLIAELEKTIGSEKTVEPERAVELGKAVG